MADENELRDLRERIGCLPFGDLCRLIEAVLAEHRRQWEEREAAHKAAVAESLEHERVLRELDRERTDLAGEKRAAG